MCDPHVTNALRISITRRGYSFKDSRACSELWSLSSYTCRCTTQYSSLSTPSLIKPSGANLFSCYFLVPRLFRFHKSPHRPSRSHMPTPLSCRRIAVSLFFVFSIFTCSEKLRGDFNVCSYLIPNSSEVWPNAFLGIARLPHYRLPCVALLDQLWYCYFHSTFACPLQQARMHA